MNIEEAKKLNKGDYIMYHNLKYKVLNIKEHRTVFNNVYIEIKCQRKNEILWLPNKFVELIEGQ